MKIAFMFPGQGSQYVGMGKDIYDKYEQVREVYKRASEISKIDIEKISFEGNDLNTTQNTQLAIATMSLGILEVLKKQDIKPDICLGLSLGEYSALVHCGYLSFKDAIELLTKRGYYMQTLVPDEKYSMAAVIGLESEEVENVCRELNDNGLFVVPANYNYKGQIVISGNEDAINLAIEKLNDIGAKRVIKLNTSGPFHTIKLEKAKKEFEKELEKIEFMKGTGKVIKNIDGEFYNENDNMKEILSNHIISPVRFDKSIDLMFNYGIDTFVEIGPGKTLSGFIKKSNKLARTINIENVEQLTDAIKILKGEKIYNG